MKQVMSYVFVTVVGAVLLVVPASAQVSAGLNELGGSGYFEIGGYSGESDSQARLQLNLYYGRFLTDRFEIGPGFNIVKAQGESASGAVNAFADYHFGDTSSSLVPYVETSIGKFFSGADDKPLFVAVGPGLKWFFADGGGALNAITYYRRQFLDADHNDGASGLNEFGVSVGVAVYFGR